MKVLGLDIGERRIGVAVSDELGCTAQGLRVLERRGLDTDIEALKALIRDQGASQIVVGLPKNMDGSVGEGARNVLSFAQTLEDAVSVPVILWDERWTTAEARRVLLQADLSRRKRRYVIDKIAAALILQGYLDSLDHSGRGGLPS